MFKIQNKCLFLDLCNYYYYYYFSQNRNPQLNATYLSGISSYDVPSPPPLPQPHHPPTVAEGWEIKTNSTATFKFISDDLDCNVTLPWLFLMMIVC